MLHKCEHFFSWKLNLILSCLHLFYTHPKPERQSSQSGKIWKLENWEKFGSAVLANIQFLCFCELGKTWKYSLRPTLKILILNLRMHWEKLCPNLSCTVENKGNLYEIRLVTFQTQHNEWDIELPWILSIYQWK